MTSNLNAAVLVLARLLLAAIFVQSGFDKLMTYAGTAAYFGKLGIPPVLTPLVILTELGGGLLVLIGWQTRWAALALAGFCIVSALIAHLDFSNQMQMINFMKNLAMAGGFLALFAAGPGRWSVDRG
jgi:putative oxidoreductase